MKSRENLFKPVKRALVCSRQSKYSWKPVLRKTGRWRVLQSSYSGNLWVGLDNLLFGACPPHPACLAGPTLRPTNPSLFSPPPPKAPLLSQDLASLMAEGAHFIHMTDRGFACLFIGHTWQNSGVLLPLCLEITHGRLGRPFRMLGIESGLVLQGQGLTYPTVLSCWP